MSVNFRSVGPVGGTVVGFNTGTSFSITYPDSVQPSDVCIMQVSTPAQGNISAPPDWTEFGPEAATPGAFSTP